MTQRKAYGRRPPKNAPALQLGRLLTGVVPEHPVAADYLSSIGGWQMLGNDQYGDCVAVALGNIRKVTTAVLGDKAYEPTLADCLAFYKTQNPRFPSEDNGMVEQTALETLHQDGAKYYDGVAPLAFAKVDVTNEAELDAAVAIFGCLLLGIDVTYANEDQFDAGQPWDYDSSSPNAGGHAVVEGGYNEGKRTGEFETWAVVTTYTDAFRQHQLEEAWVVIWPEHLGSKAFLEGVDLAQLAADYKALTGKDFPAVTPPSPTPTPTPTPTPPLNPFEQELQAAYAAFQHAWAAFRKAFDRWVKSL